MDLIELNKKIKKIKPDKLKYDLPEVVLKKNPFELFKEWFQLALEYSNTDPSAMVLSTVDKEGFPDSRVVLLKELEEQRFIFFTGYDSKKAQQLEAHPVVALNFYWPDLFCQIRVRGQIKKLGREQSELYFASRPREAQLGTHAWIQSSVVASRDELDENIRIQAEKFENQTIPCPSNWGGFIVQPVEYEFFLRKQWRRHDRIFYKFENEAWIMQRLAP